MNVSTYTRTQVITEVFDAVEIKTNYFDERRISLDPWQLKRITALAKENPDLMICIRDMAYPELCDFVRWDSQVRSYDMFLDFFSGRWHPYPHHIMARYHMNYSSIKRIKVICF